MSFAFLSQVLYEIKERCKRLFLSSTQNLFYIVVLHTSNKFFVFICLFFPKNEEFHRSPCCFFFFFSHYSSLQSIFEIFGII